VKYILNNPQQVFKTMNPIELNRYDAEYIIGSEDEAGWSDEAEEQRWQEEDHEERKKRLIAEAYAAEDWSVSTPKLKLQLQEEEARFKRLKNMPILTPPVSNWLAPPLIKVDNLKFCEERNKAEIERFLEEDEIFMEEPPAEGVRLSRRAFASSNFTYMTFVNGKKLQEELANKQSSAADEQK
jgi:hypothetical protein